MTVEIYALIDPRNNAIRYIGATCIGIEKRLKYHLGEAKRHDGTHLWRWLRVLINLGLSPLATKLEAVSIESSWQERERYWIAHGRSRGWRLTNATDGGEGLHNPSEGVRRKLSMAAMGKSYASGKRSEEFKRKAAENAKITKTVNSS